MLRLRLEEYSCQFGQRQVRLNRVYGARFLGIARSTQCDIEKGRQLVSPELAARIAGACGLSRVVAVETALMDQIRRAGLSMRVFVKPARKAA